MMQSAQLLAIRRVLFESYSKGDNEMKTKTNCGCLRHSLGIAAEELEPRTAIWRVYMRRR